MKKKAFAATFLPSSAGSNLGHVFQASCSRRGLSYGKYTGQKQIVAIFNYSGIAPETSSVRQNTDVVSITKIERLIQYGLSSPIMITIETDADGFIARAIELPLYGFADSPVEAVTRLKKEIETLYDDLQKDDEFSEEWLSHKKYLQAKIVSTQE